MATRINLPCNGNGGNNNIAKVRDTITFGTSGNCTFTNFQFTTNDPPPGFSNKQPANGTGATVSYDYDGSDIPAAGYAFTYDTTDKASLGNGSGVIRNS
jgi:hypothetical protein